MGDRRVLGRHATFADVHPLRLQDQGWDEDGPLAQPMRVPERPDSPIVWAPNAVTWGNRSKTTPPRVVGDTTVVAETPEVVRIDRIPIPLRATVLSQIDVSTPPAAVGIGTAANVTLVVEQGAGQAVITRKHFTLNVPLLPGVTTIWPEKVTCGGEYISVKVVVEWINLAATAPLDEFTAKSGIIIVPETSAIFHLLGDSRL